MCKVGQVEEVSKNALFLEATDIPFFPLRLSLRENEAKET
jgi:hypothetical protein